MEVETKTIKTPYGDEKICAKCESDVNWEECYDCEEGYRYHDCGEDTCCCLDPQSNVKCYICGDEGGWFRCYNCESKEEKQGLNLASNEENIIAVNVSTQSKKIIEGKR